MTEQRGDALDTTLSAEIFFIALENSKYLIYAPLRRAAFIGNRSAADFLRRLRSGSLPPDANPDRSMLQLLRGLQIVGAGPERQPVSECAGEPMPTGVTLFLTTTCNLRCRYCYASAGNEPAKAMSMETAKRGIDFVAGNAARTGSPGFEVAYHGGGEPTLHWRVLTESFAYAKRKAVELGMQLRTSLATNGVLSGKKLDWIVANLDGVNLSCDGLPEIHDECRPAANGGGSSRRVLHTMRHLDEAGFRYGIRLTVMAEYISRLPDSVDFIFSRFRPSAAQIEPVYLLGRGRTERSAETDEFIEAFRIAREGAAGRGRQILFSGARVGALTSHFCGTSRDNFCLSADGNVSACHEAFSEAGPLAGIFFYGHPSPGPSGYSFDREVLNHLRAQTVDRREHCRDCFARWSCGGDCYYKWLAASGDTAFNGSARCHVIRELSKDQILEKISNSGGLFWHDPPSWPERDFSLMERC